ncbi:MAG: hypothetical protein PWQ50_193 [Methanolobus sp.]|nr:hypothetical protein [Methanolobus sp.]
MEYNVIKQLKEKHPSLKLLNADNSPLITQCDLAST